MDTSTELERERAFLHQQVEHTRHKIARFEGSIATCGDCPERDGLNAMLKSAQIELEILQQLSDLQSQEKTLSLQALVMDQTRDLKKQAESLSREWKRGKSTPPAYWELENRINFLSTLLTQYHAWHGGRSYYDPAPEESPEAQHPWFVPFESSDVGHSNGGGDPLDTLYYAIKTALSDQPEGHLDIIVETPHQVIVTGYAHSDNERQHIIDTIRQIEGVREMVLDLKAVTPERCPICEAARRG
jgi:hypothetical protein